MTPTTPPAIPSDIWEAARSLRTQVIWESNATIETIARALLAAQERGKLMERERCAGIADDHDRSDGTGPDCQGCGELIAARILEAN